MVKWDFISFLWYLLFLDREIGSDFFSFSLRAFVTSGFPFSTPSDSEDREVHLKGYCMCCLVHLVMLICSGFGRVACLLVYCTV